MFGVNIRLTTKGLSGEWTMDLGLHGFTALAGPGNEPGPFEWETRALSIAARSP